MRSRIIALPALLSVGLMLGACSGGPRGMYGPSPAYAGPPGPAVVEEGPPAPAYGGGVEVRSGVYARTSYGSGRRGQPSCGGAGHFDPKYGKCVGNQLHDIPLSAEARDRLASCGQIETRYVERGNRIVQQQRCAR